MRPILSWRDTYAWLEHWKSRNLLQVVIKEIIPDLKLAPASQLQRPVSICILINPVKFIDKIGRPVPV